MNILMLTPSSSIIRVFLYPRKMLGLLITFLYAAKLNLSGASSGPVYFISKFESLKEAIIT